MNNVTTNNTTKSTPMASIMEKARQYHQAKRSETVINEDTGFSNEDIAYFIDLSVAGQLETLKEPLKGTLGRPVNIYDVAQYAVQEVYTYLVLDIEPSQEDPEEFVSSAFGTEANGFESDLETDILEGDLYACAFALQAFNLIQDEDGGPIETDVFNLWQLASRIL